MPSISGFDVQSHLAANAATRVAVVVVTAHDSPASQERALAGGAAAYLKKPVDGCPLLDAIRAAIAQLSDQSVDEAQ